jgi:hypothetical protein
MNIPMEPPLHLRGFLSVDDDILGLHPDAFLVTPELDASVHSHFSLKMMHIAADQVTTTPE